MSTNWVSETQLTQLSHDQKVLWENIQLMAEMTIQVIKIEVNVLNMKSAQEKLNKVLHN